MSFVRKTIFDIRRILRMKYYFLEIYLSDFLLANF